MVLGYMYVLKQIAEVEKKGNISFNDISGHLKLSTQQLKGLLEIMEGMGHIEKVAEDNSGLSTSCSGSCKSCGFFGCSGKNTVSYGTIYKLTEKGRRVCHSQTG
ncbi:MAG: FeoC-like transcriptional regulator [Methanosarcina sp.]